MQHTLLILAILVFARDIVSAEDPAALELDRAFATTVHPFLETYCFGCHGTEKQKGKLDLSPYSNTVAVTKDFRRWETVLEKLQASEMPPEEAKRHPSPELSRDIIQWIQTARRHEAKKNAGDPGIVLARRLSNAEYDYTIRDLTGVDIRPTKEFPVDPANEAGFDNSGESLAMSPALLRKYLDAARQVAEHVVLKPSGFVFAPYSMASETDRDKYCIQRIVDFYQRQPTNYANYFMGAWRFKNRALLGKPNATLTEIASENNLSPKYLTGVWKFLTDLSVENGPATELRNLWRELPAQTDVPRSACERMAEFVVEARRKLRPQVKNLAIRGIAPGSQPFVLWKDRQYEANRMRSSSTNSEIPAERFCATFPDAFSVSERGLIFLDEDNESKGRLLSAGFHLMAGYFRDDAPLCKLVLDDGQREELDGLWRELNFITLAPLRQYKDFIFFERAEPPRFMQGAGFDFARSEDKDAISESKIGQLREAYIAKARRNGGEGVAIQAIEDYFKNISAEIRAVEEMRLAAEPSHLEALLNFAERAYRRPLSQAEHEDLLGFYHSLRDREGLGHEEAMRDTIASVLVSPSFCYRIDLPGSGQAVCPLPDYALASRLSYFLWSTMPDHELLLRAAAVDLHRPEVLAAQAARMLKDARIRGLAAEFGGNWLDFRRFEEHNSVDRERFKSFNNELRQAMFEEPIHFFIDLVQNDRSVLDFLYGEYTFVNPSLARHYGIPDGPRGSNEWVRVEHALRYQRGGLLPMSVFLTKNAPGLRTSPVKRGYWVVRRLLGENIPPPPPKVPELPADESKMGDLTLREALARHRQDKSCAGCHEHFDSMGLVFEGYGPVGEIRQTDFAGHPVDARATFPGGSQGEALEGLKNYLREHRQADFLDNLCRKMLAYALGRTLLLSDDGLIEKMRGDLEAQSYRFSSLIENIVTSPQFLTKRAEERQTEK